MITCDRCDKPMKASDIHPTKTRFLEITGDGCPFMLTRNEGAICPDCQRSFANWWNRGRKGDKNDG